MPDLPDLIYLPINFKGHLMRKNILITALLLTGMSASSVIAAEPPPEHTKGAVGGMVVGAVAGGPFGAVAGTVLGAEVFGRLFAQRRENRELGVRIAGLRSKIERQNEKLARTNEQARESERLISELNTDIDKLLNVQLAIARGQRLPVQFRTASSDIETQYEAELANIARVLRRNADASVNLTGYADRRGDEQYNQRLSEKRIQAIETFLLQNGASQNQILGVAYGESRPLSVEETLESNFYDRRVLVELSLDIDPQLATR